MTITRVGAGTPSLTAGGTSSTTTKTGVTVGNLVVCEIGLVNGAASYPAAAIAADTGWTALENPTGTGDPGSPTGSFSPVSAGLFAKIATSTTETFNTSGWPADTYIQGVIVEYSTSVGTWNLADPAKTSVVNATNGTSGTGTVTTPSSTAAADAVVFSVCTVNNKADNTSGLGTPSGYTLDLLDTNDGDNFPIACSSKIVSAAGAQSAAWTWTTGSGDGYVALLAAVSVSSGGGGDVSVNLTGVSATGSVGTITAGVAPTLSGNTGTGSVGTVSRAIAASLTGNAATGGVGTVAPAIDTTLSGVSGDGSQVGTVVASTGGDVTLTLTGVEASGQVGTIAPAVDAFLTSQDMSGQAGSVTPAVDAFLTSVDMSGQAGTVSPAIDTALTSVDMTGQVGTVTVQAGADVTLTLTGVAATGQVGSVVAALAVGLSGNAAAGQVGTVTANSGGVTPTMPGIDVDIRRPRARTANFQPILARKLEEKAARLVRPAHDRAAARAKAIEREAAAAALQPETTDAEMRGFLERWSAERPVVPPMFRAVDPMELFLAQVAFRVRQAQQLQAAQLEAQRAAIEAANRRRRQDEDALLALLLT